jgi:hypothetical protein
MTKTEAVSLAVGVLGLVLTIPGTVGFLSQGSRPLGFVTLVLAVALIAVGVVAYLREQRPPFSIRIYQLALDIKDRDGKEAVFRKTLTLQPNYPGLDVFHHRPFSNDGRRTTARVDPGVRIIDDRTEANEHYIVVQFVNPPRRGVPISTWIEHDFTDAFTGDSEAFGFRVAVPIQRVVVRITFIRPIDPQSAVLVLEAGGLQKTMALTKVELHSIEWEYVARFRRVPPGEYLIHWRHV